MPKKENVVTEQRKFRASNNLIMITIKDQAGTVAKAVLEAVMNSIDAGAKNISVSVSATNISITDDGRGFTEEGVKTFFEEFGMEHDLDEEGISTDARFGTFRIGRGQLFAFGSNLWRSNTLSMDVDIQSRGLDYTFTKGLEQQPGCSIEVSLYDALSLHEVRSTIDEITRFCRYVEHNLLVNGEAVSVDPKKEKWDVINDDVYIRRKDDSGNRWRGGGLDVYQQGVFVENISSHVYGVSGTVLIRKPIKLNTARNQIIRNKPGWRKIAAILTNDGIQQARKKTRLTADEARSFVEKLVDGGVKYSDFTETRCLPDTQGKLWSLKEMLVSLNSRAKKTRIMLGSAGELRVGFAAKGCQVADRVMQLKRAIVFDEAIIKQLRCDSEKGKVKQMNAALDILRGVSPLVNEANFCGRYDRFYGKLSLIDPYELLEGKDSDYHLIDVSDWTPREELIVRGFSHIVYDMHRAVHGWCNQEKRSLRLGLSDLADGWTDGSSYIAINRTFINGMNFGLERDWHKCALLLAHELCHTGPDTESHEHTPQFYEDYHDMSVHAPNAARSAYQYYRSVVVRLSKKKPKNVMTQLHIEAEGYVASQLAFEKTSVADV